MDSQIVPIGYCFWYPFLSVARSKAWELNALPGMWGSMASSGLLEVFVFLFQSISFTSMQHSDTVMGTEITDAALLVIKLCTPIKF